jgi:SNF2 family DNA or RNA helicase
MSTIPPEVRQERNPLGQLPIASAQSEANITRNNTDPKKKALLPNAKDVNTDTISNVNDLTTLMAQKLHVTDTHSHVAADEYNIDNDDDDDFDEEGGTTTTTKTVDWKKENKEMDKMFDSQAAKQLRDLPPFEMPEGFQKHVKFFDHQKDGLRWLLQQETNAPPNPFVRKRQLKGGTVALYDRLTRGRIAKAHAPIKGSILADDMGLGKTVQTLGLVLSNPPTFGIGNNDPPLCTLIVCPKTVISNWINQIEDFVTPGQFLIETYNGTPKQRSKIIQQVVEDNTIDILLSTYETIAAEFGKERPGLLSIHDTNVRFHRIVLDEAQQIRNPKSRSFRSIQALAERSEFRLALR